MGNTQTKIPEKNTFYQVKEHFAEDFPVWTQDGFEIVKLQVEDLFTSDTEKLKKVGERIVEGLKNDNILILQNSPEFIQKSKVAFEEAKKFLSQSQEQKEIFSAEKIDGKRAFYSGYSLIHFENRDNKRDQEWRDVFQIRYGEEDRQRKDVPWPSEDFKKASKQHYEAQWSICVQVLHAMAVALSINPLDLLTLAVGESHKVNDIKSSINTNLCFFHYYDKFMSYKTPQKCMVHRDHGLLTLLPKTDLPGLELLHPRLQQWIPIEQFIDSDDVLLYCGEALAMVTNSRVEPATHRVVRLPQKERFSMPFEVKPNDDAVLRNLVNPSRGQESITFDGLSKRFQWQRVMKQVNRADGIDPGPVVQETVDDTQPDFGQAHHDVQLPGITVK